MVRADAGDGRFADDDAEVALARSDQRTPSPSTPPLGSIIQDRVKYIYKYTLHMNFITAASNRFEQEGLLIHPQHNTSSLTLLYTP